VKQETRRKDRTTKRKERRADKYESPATGTESNYEYIEPPDPTGYTDLEMSGR